MAIFKATGKEEESTFNLFKELREFGKNYEYFVVMFLGLPKKIDKNKLGNKAFLADLSSVTGTGFICRKDEIYISNKKKTFIINLDELKEQSIESLIRELEKDEPFINMIKKDNPDIGMFDGISSVPCKYKQEVDGKKLTAKQTIYCDHCEKEIWTDDIKINKAGKNVAQFKEKVKNYFKLDLEAEKKSEGIQ